MLGTRFWNNFLFREYDYSSDNGGSQFHQYGNGWWEPDFNYYYSGNEYFGTTYKKGNGHTETPDKQYDYSLIYEAS